MHQVYFRSKLSNVFACAEKSFLGSDWTSSSKEFQSFEYSQTEDAKKGESNFFDCLVFREEVGEGFHLFRAYEHL